MRTISLHPQHEEHSLYAILMTEAEAVEVWDNGHLEESLADALSEILTASGYFARLHAEQEQDRAEYLAKAEAASAILKSAMPAQEKGEALRALTKTHRVHDEVAYDIPDVGPERVSEVIGLLLGREPGRSRGHGRMWRT